jgi:flagellar motor switch protein FliN/FliY
MSENIELQQLAADDSFEPTAPPVGPDDLRRLSDVPVDVSVEMGRTRMTVGETLELRQGSIVTLNRMAGEPVDLLVNGTTIARGEVVVIDEQFGLRITDVIGQSTAPTPVAGQDEAPEQPVQETVEQAAQAA